jgi:hypothetical protein
MDRTTEAVVFEGRPGKLGGKLQRFAWILVRGYALRQVGQTQDSAAPTFVVEFL